MRLLNVKTRLLEEFFEGSIPKYAILSHTWQANEVTFQDLQSSPELSSRSTKLEGCCRQAAKDGYGYVWIDTCCIDKSSSAELSEAINSMFSWYGRSEVCYVYLADVSADLDPDRPESDFRKSRWFTRGWTLQELLAPSRLHFYDKKWGLIGNVNKSVFVTSSGQQYLLNLLSEITDIPRDFIVPQSSLNRASIAQRMSWASRRATTRAEDEAYCLLGIFGVNMPLIYGEGRRAFRRLQEEILKASDDQSIFSWGYGLTKIPGAQRTIPPPTEALAKQVADFCNCGKIKEYEMFQSSHYSITNKGLLIELPLLELESGDFLGCINCTADDATCIAIPLIQADENVFCRSQGPAPLCVPVTIFEHIKPQQIYINSRYSRIPRPALNSRLRINHEDAHLLLFPVEIKESYPQSWSPGSGYIAGAKSDRQGKFKDIKTFFLALTVCDIKIALKVIYCFEGTYDKGQRKYCTPRSVEFFFKQMEVNDALWRFIVEEQICISKSDASRGKPSGWISDHFHFVMNSKHFIVYTVTLKRKGSPLSLEFKISLAVGQTEIPCSSLPEKHKSVDHLKTRN